MTRRHTHTNVAARMGRWSAAHWKTATFGWLALVVVAFAVGGAVGTKSLDPNAAGPGQSGRMDRILDAGFEQPAGESVLVQSGSLRTTDPAFRAAVGDVISGLSGLHEVQHVHRGSIASSRHAVLVDFSIRGDKSKAADKIQPVLDAVAAAKQAHPGFSIGEFGDASAQKGVETAFAADLAKAGLLSLPLTLVILAVAFGALVAAGIPLLLALTAVFATFGLLALPSQVLPMAMQAPAIVLLIGLAVGVDYSMFYLRRWREERAAGRAPAAALEAAAATSGRSVLVSGLTVIVAMAGMFLTGDRTFASLGVATIMVVAVAVLGSLTVLPALLSKLGDRIERGRLPLVGRRAASEGRIWGAIVDRVLRRPALSAALAGGLLVALAVPALQLDMVQPGPETFPQSLQVVKTYERMQQAFPGAALPATVVVKAPNVNTPAVRAAIGRLERQALASGRMHGPFTVDVNRDATVANVTVPIDGTGADGESLAAIHVLRGQIVPQTVGAVATVEDAGVTGLGARWMDGTDEMTSNLPPVVAFVLVLAFALMLVAFRSIVVAAKAIVLNLLSVAAAYGVLVLVFQHGFGQGLLGLGSTAGISPEVPLLLFVILFGLSMDYHVLVVSRIREAYDRGATMDDAISLGIRRTAGAVTSAAVVMVGVFSIFATLSMLMFKQFGVGLAAAILIDATIVRGVLLPATMKLLGEWNWYLPRSLEWLPRLEGGAPEAHPAPVAAPAPATSGFTPARIVALTLVGAAALGLAYLHFARDAGAVSVPKGAHAGQLVMHPCTYETEQGGYAADCGTLVVPENRADPGSRLIALPVTRIRARSPHPAEPIFRLEGGPGRTDMQFAKASRLADDHDVVLVGYRGVDGSVRLDCPEVESALSHSTDLLSARSTTAYADGFRTCASRLRSDGVDLAGYSLVQTVDDLEAARKALGYGRIDLVSESAGTRTALIYGRRYPRSINRSAMIGVNPPGHFLWSGDAIDRQLTRYSELCARDETCSRRTGDLAAAMKREDAQIPDRYFFLPIDRSAVRVASFYELMESTSEAAPLSGPMTIGSWLAAANGDASGFWLQSLLAHMAFPKSFVWGELAAMGRADAAAARRQFATGARDGTIIGNPGTDFIWAGGRLADVWPAEPDESEYARVRPSNVETLLIGGELDGATPPASLRTELLPSLRNGRLVVLPQLGHTTDFWSYEPKASTRLLTAFLDSGRVDASLYTPAHVDWTPDVTQTALGKGFAGAIVGLPILAFLSLALMALRVRRRGRVGRKSAAVLRSVYPIVLGLGGWFLGVLIALTAFPGTPLDDARLAVLSASAPVGLGVYLAWMRRDRSARAKVTGFFAASVGALAGGWLGFHAATDLLALVTTIVGATAGGNLALLVLDVAWDRRDAPAGRLRAQPRLNAEAMLNVPASPA